MPEKDVVEAAHRDAEQGKSPSTQAGEFVRREFEHVREGKHGARSTKQAIAIGLSKARRAGVELHPPKNSSGKVRKQAERDSSRGESAPNAQPSSARSHAVSKALRREGHASASHSAVSRQAKSTARKRGAAARSRSAKKAARTRRSG